MSQVQIILPSIKPFGLLQMLHKQIFLHL